MIKKILSSVAVFSHKNSKAILVTGLLLTLVLGFFATKLKLNSNFIYLVPQDSETVKSFWEASSDFGATEFLVGLIEIKDGRRDKLHKLQTFGDFYVSEIAKIPEVSTVEHKIDKKKQKFLADFFVENSLLYLDKTDLEKVLAKLSDEKIGEQIQTDKELLTSPIGSTLKKTIIQDPLLISEILKNYYERITGKSEEAFGAKKEWYFLSEDEQALLVLIKPTKLAQDVEFSKVLMQKVYTATEKAFADFDGGGAKETLQIGFAGGYVSSLSNAKSIKRDLIVSSSIVLIGIIFIFYLFYRNKRSLFYIILPLLMGITWTLGLAYFLIGSLNVITIVSSALLMGLGIDYSIHIYNRYLEEELKEIDALQKIRNTFQSTGVSVSLGALSSAIAFSVLMITDFRGLSELGLLAGMGLIVILLTMFTIFPAEISLWGIAKDANKKLHFQESLCKLMDKNFCFVITHPKYIVTGTVIITILMLITLTGIFPTKLPGIGIPFEEDMQKIRPESDADILIQEKISTKFNSNFKPLYVISKAKNSNEVIEQVSVLSIALDTLQAKGLVENYQTITNYIPPLSRQKSNIELIKKIDIEKVISKTKEELKLQGLKADKFNFDYLRKAFLVRKPITIEEFERLGLHDIISKFYVKKDNEYRVKTQVFLNGYVEDLSKVSDFETELKLGGINDTVTGIRIVVAEFMGIIKHDFFLATFAALLAVIFTVTLTYRRTKHIILSLIPLTIGIIWMFGAMKILGISMNYANIIVTPLIIGIGIDYGIYILTRYLEDGKNDILLAVRETGQSLIFGALTTLVGFGSLIFSQNRGLESVGHLAILGITFCAINSLIFLPALLELVNRREKLILERQ